MRMLSGVFIAVFVACILGTGAWGEDGWGNSGAMPMPVKDSKRTNHWWWPKTPSPESHAEYTLAVPNVSDVNQAKNRRVVFVYRIED